MDLAESALGATILLESLADYEGVPDEIGLAIKLIARDLEERATPVLRMCEENDERVYMSELAEHELKA